MSESMRETARDLRKGQTASEKAFWEIVRNRKLGVKFLRQFAIPFLYEGRKRYFIADFYCSERKLVVEIDGRILFPSFEKRGARGELIISWNLFLDFNYMQQYFG